MSRKKTAIKGIQLSIPFKNDGRDDRDIVLSISQSDSYLVPSHIRQKLVDSILWEDVYKRIADNSISYEVHHNGFKYVFCQTHVDFTKNQVGVKYLFMDYTRLYGMKEHKYIRTKEGEFILFPVTIAHNNFKQFKPISAGFCRISNNIATCYGESISLGIKSNEDDSRLMTNQFREVFY